MEPLKRVTVEIYNERYVVRGNARVEYIQAVAREVDERIRALAVQHPRASLNRLAVLAALHFADELAQLKEQHERVVGMLEREWQRRGIAREAPRGPDEAEAPGGPPAG
ncbi:MAG: cell division protein ZapA [Clostridia bacterium]|nr:cell division protein ZapA [Clostridia bacterium]